MLRLITQSSDIVQELRRLQSRPITPPWPVMAKVMATMEVWSNGDFLPDSPDFPQRISGAQLDAAYQRLAPGKLSVIRQACGALEQVYQGQLPKAQVSFPEDGTVQGGRFYPIKRAGFYLEQKKGDVLGNLLRQAMLAKTAGVTERVLVTPSQDNGEVAPEILVAAQEMGIEEIYLAQGQTAIAFLAWGTNNIAPVESITGVGSLEVMVAKHLVSGVVTVDQTLGRTDLMLLADGEANPQLLALDLLAHGEQHPNSSGILLTDRQGLAQEVTQWVSHYCRAQEHSVHTEKAIAHYGFAGVVENLSLCGDWVNEFEPHTLMLAVNDPWGVVEKVQRAREIYIGQNSPSILGHYLSGAHRLHCQQGALEQSSELALHCFLRSSQLLDYGSRSSPGWLRDLVSWQGLTAIEARLRFSDED